MRQLLIIRVNSGARNSGQIHISSLISTHDAQSRVEAEKWYKKEDRTNHFMLKYFCHYIIFSVYWSKLYPEQPADWPEAGKSQFEIV